MSRGKPPGGRREGVDVLADEGDFHGAGSDKGTRLVQQVRDRAGHFRPARIRHYAEGAELVAAFLHGEKGRRPLVAAGREMAELALAGHVGVDDGLAGTGARQQLRQTMIGQRTDHHIDSGRAPGNLLALGLRHAASRDDHGLVRPLLQPADVGIELLAGLFTDMAGVQHHDVGVFGRVGRRHALLAKQIRHAGGVIDIHLAAEGFDVEARHAGLRKGSDLHSGTAGGRPVRMSQR